MSPSSPTISRWMASLHPVALLTYFLMLFLMAMTYTHPLYLGAIAIAVMCGIRTAGAWSKWRRYLNLSIVMTLCLVVVNVLVSRNGNTVIFQGPRVPLFGAVLITHEALCFGLNMGLKFFVILSIFCLFEALMPADKSFGFFSRFIPHSALLVTMSTLLIPQMKRHVSKIYAVMKCRGAKFDDRGIENIRSRYPLVKVLFVSSLEDSWQTAEALYARAFGLGKRTCFRKDDWHIGNTIIVLSSLIVGVVYLLSLSQHKGLMKFYPVIDPTVEAMDVWMIGLLLLGCMALPLLGIGWRRWNSSHSAS